MQTFEVDGYRSNTHPMCALPGAWILNIRIWDPMRCHSHDRTACIRNGDVSFLDGFLFPEKEGYVRHIGPAITRFFNAYGELTDQQSEAIPCVQCDPHPDYEAFGVRAGGSQEARALLATWGLREHGFFVLNVKTWQTKALKFNKPYTSARVSPDGSTILACTQSDVAAEARTHILLLDNPFA